MEIKYFTEDELKKLFKIIKNDNSKYGFRNLVIFQIAYYCSLRASEIGMLEKNYYNRTSKELYCKRLKGSNNNTIKIIDREILRNFEKYIKLIDSNILFKSQMDKSISRKTLDVLMKKYCFEAKIEDKSKWHFHTLKHTRAVNLAELGLDLKEIQYWLGHKEIKNTQIYFQFTSSQYDFLYKKLENRMYKKGFV